MDDDGSNKFIDVAILILSVAALALSVGILFMGVAAICGVIGIAF